MSNALVQSLFTLILLVQSRFIKSTVDFFVDDLETYHNPNYMKNFKLWVENNKIYHRQYRVNMETNTSGLGRQIFFRFKLYEKSKKDGPPTLKIIDYTVDLCRTFEKNRKSDIFYKFSLDIMTRFGHVPTSCPVKDDFYYFYNLTMQSIPFPMLSTFAFGVQTHYAEMTYNFYKKGKNNVVPFLNVTFIGGYYSS